MVQILSILLRQKSRERDSFFLSFYGGWILSNSFPRFRFTHSVSEKDKNLDCGRYQNGALIYIQNAAQVRKQRAHLFTIFQRIWVSEFCAKLSIQLCILLQRKNYTPIFLGRLQKSVGHKTAFRFLICAALCQLL